MQRFPAYTIALFAGVIGSHGSWAQTTNAPAAAAGAASSGPAPNPCASDAQRHRFDFWIGEWSVTAHGGVPVGNSVIESVSGGCAILENWTGLRGGHGKSLNTYNPYRHQWQQFWVGQDGGVGEYRSSEFDGTSLAFFIKDSSDSLAVQRLTFTPIDSVTVRQHSETSKDGGKNWTTQYDFYYHRKPKS